MKKHIEAILKDKIIIKGIKMKAKITEEQLKRMNELKVEGTTISEISKIMGLPYAKVAYYVGDYKRKIVERNKINRKKHKDELNELNTKTETV